jgi:hypothetical protein
LRVPTVWQPIARNEKSFLLLVEIEENLPLLSR